MNGELKTVGGKLVYDPPCGSRIDDVARKCIGMAQDCRQPIHFSFNGIELVAKSGDNFHEISHRFKVECERKAEEYRNSPKGREQARKRALEVTRNQSKANELFDSLPSVEGNLDALLPWLVEFSEVADDVAIVVDFSVVAYRLERHWKENAHVGRPKEDFADRRVMGEYIVGQAINCLRKGMPPHPITETFVKQYQAARP